MGTPNRLRAVLNDVMRALILSLFVSAVAPAAFAQESPIPLAPDQAVEGYLTMDSPKQPDFAAPYACYVLETQPGETWEVDVEANDFPSALMIGKGDTCAAVWEDIWNQMPGDIRETGFPVVNFTSHVGGPYMVSVSAERVDAKGPFLLTARRVPAP